MSNGHNMSALDTLLATQQAPNILGAYNQGQQTGMTNRLNQIKLQQAQRQQAQQPMLDAQAAQDRVATLDSRQRAMFDDAVKKVAASITGNESPEAYRQILQGLPLDPKAKQALGQYSPAAIRSLAGDTSGLTSGQREFADLTTGLSNEDKQQARMVKLGLSPRAVGSAVQTIAAQDIAELIGDTEAIINERKKFGEMTGSSRARTIDNGFEKIAKIDLGINNIDRAIIAVRDQGADTGAITKLFPSISDAAVELDNIIGAMALDVIGSVTLGAISAPELKMARDIALPEGMEGEALIDHLTKRKAAQVKLRGIINEQIQFLDQGGTVAGYMRMKEREKGQQPTGNAQGATTQPQGSKYKIIEIN